MRGIVSLFACAVCIAYLLAPTKAHTEIAERPNTPLVTVLEIGPKLGHNSGLLSGKQVQFRWSESRIREPSLHFGELRLLAQ